MEVDQILNDLPPPPARFSVSSLPPQGLIFGSPSRRLNNHSVELDSDLQGIHKEEQQLQVSHGFNKYIFPFSLSFLTIFDHF